MNNMKKIALFFMLLLLSVNDNMLFSKTFDNSLNNDTVVVNMCGFNYKCDSFDLDSLMQSINDYNEHLSYYMDSLSEKLENMTFEKNRIHYYNDSLKMNLESCFKGFEKTFENLDVVFEMYSPILKKMDTACFAELGNLSEEFDYSMEEFDNYGKKWIWKKDTVYSNKIEKSFDVSKTSRFIFDGKFSNLNIKTWNEDKIEIDVRMIVLSDSKIDKSKFDDVFDVNIYKKNKDVYLYASMKNNRNNRNYNNETLIFVCDVKMPEYMSMDVTSYYADVKLQNVHKPSSFNINYGSLSGLDSYDKIDLKLKYGNCKFDNISDLDAAIYYSDCNFMNCSSYNGTVYYSDIKFQDVNNMDMSLYYSDLVTGNIGSLIISANYSDVVMNDILNSCNANLSYSDMIVKKITTNCTECKIKGVFSEIKVFNEKDGKTIKYDEMFINTSL